jgi:short-subunit dehydrogenase
MHLKNKVVLITGASEGIGAACAEALIGRGALLSVTARNASKLESLYRGSALVTPGDLTDPSLRRLVVDRSLAEYGRIDVLVNNAGIGSYEPAHSAPLLHARQLFELNFFAALDMIQLVSPHMKYRRTGVIVNISSIAGKTTLPWFTAYSASKAAICSLTEGVRTELSRYGIHAMTVCPGYVQTGFQEHVISGRPPALVGRMRKWTITSAKCAEDIVRGLERGARTVVTPWSGWMLIGLARVSPRLVERLLAKVYFSDHAPSQEVQSAL